MFTVKICDPGKNTYYETDSFETEVVCGGNVMLKFSAQNDEKRVLFVGVSDRMDLQEDGASIAERAYIMNGQGKTIEVIR